MEIKIGEPVRLRNNSVSPDMTIVGISESNQDYLICAWFVENNLKNACFHKDCLKYPTWYLRYLSKVNAQELAQKIQDNIEKTGERM